MKKKRIYIDSGPLLNPHLSGIGHVTLYMLKGLASHKAITDKYEIRLIIPKLEGDLLKQWDITGVTPVYLPVRSRIWNLFARFWFAPPIDIFLGRGIYIFTNYRRWPLLFSRSITYVHDISFELFPQFAEPNNLRMLKNNMRRWIARSTLIVTDSQTSKKEIEEFYGLGPNKVKSIYCGVDPAIFAPTDPKRVGDVRWKYGLQKPYIFFLSNLEPRKNIERLIEAFTLLPKELKERYGLLLVGGMSWRSEGIAAAMERARANGCDIIKPSEYVPDYLLPALLTGADALVHPAHHEGFGIPVIEAMACGTPTVVSNIPVMREVAGDAALFADPLDAKDIADKIVTVLTDQELRKKLIADGIQQAARYRWDKAVKELAGCIDELEGTVK